MTTAIDLVMPKLGLTMTEGRIARWSVAPGAAFAKGQCLVEIETDKIVNEVEATADGILSEIVVAAEQTVAVGTVIARWQPAGAIVETPPARRIIATPYARKLAREQGLRLDDLTGSGPNDRIKAADVTRAAATRPPPEAKPATPPTPLAVTPRAVPLTPQPATAAIAPRVSFAIADFDADRLIEMEQSLRRNGRGRRPERHHLLAIAALRALEQADPDRATCIIGAGNGEAIVAVEATTGMSGAALISRLDSATADRAHGDVVVLAHAGNARLVVPDLPAGWSATLTLGQARAVPLPAGANGIAWGQEISLALAYDARQIAHAQALALLDHVADALADPLHLLAS